VLRTVPTPVSGPSDTSWSEFRPALHAAFCETTRCANWLVTQFYLRDQPRGREDERLSKMPAIYLYPEARVLFPALASQTLASLERQVRAKYCAARLDLLWRHAVSLPTYRYPMPLPLPSRMWHLALHDERWHLSVRIGDRRWSLRLRQGPGLRRQARVFQQVAAGAVDSGEATLYEASSQPAASHGAGARERRLMVKLAVWLPRREAPEAHHTLIVRTAADAFVTAHLAGEDHRWALHADHVRRWIAEAARRQRRLRDDVAHDCRSPISDRTELAPMQRRVAEHLRRRLHTWTHQATAQLIARAQRCQVAAIIWDDTDRGYLPSYPWHQFAATLADKAAAVGIEVTARHAAHDPSGVTLAGVAPHHELHEVP
jgi:hypothetical protein